MRIVYKGNPSEGKELESREWDWKTPQFTLLTHDIIILYPDFLFKMELSRFVAFSLMVS